MAIEPFQRKIGVPDGPGVTQQGVQQIANLGPSIAKLGQEVMASFEPEMKAKAVERAKKAASLAAVRDFDGQPVMPVAPQGGGVIFNQVFDQLTEERYVNEVNFDFQNWLNAELADRRAAKNGKTFDPVDFEQTVAARTQGILQGADPSVRPQLEQTLYREGLERSRAFREEWSRTSRMQQINGLRDQYNNLAKQYAGFRERGETAQEAYEKYGKPMAKIAFGMKSLAFVGEEELTGMLMETDNLVESASIYATSMEFSAQMIPQIGGMSGEDLEVLDNWLVGAPDPRQLSGQLRVGGGSVKVTPDLIRDDFKALFPDYNPSSVDRAADHPLSLKNPTSYHNIANGGRAVDVPPIPGMTFEKYVETWKKAGYDVVEALEEVGDKKTAHATGDHWHIAFGNKKGVTATEEDPQLRGLTADEIRRLDPSVRQDLRNIVADRRAVLREQEAEARRAAAEAAREAREEARTRQIVEAITAKDRNGLYGDWTGDQRKALDATFASSVDLSRLNDPGQQGKAVAFVQNYGFLPDSLNTYITNNIRSGDWDSAVRVYRGVKNATTKHGQNLGDLFIEQLDGRTRALLETTDEMIRAGVNPVAIGARVEALRSKRGSTTNESIASFETTTGKKFQPQRDAAIRSAYGIPSNARIPQWIIRTVEEGYAANLDIKNDPNEALQTSIAQSKGVYTRSSVFTDGVGPTALTRSYPLTELGKFFGQYRDATGRQVFAPRNGKPFTVGGTIKLRPADDSTGQIGYYEVHVFNPENPSQLIDRFTVDLGSELRKWSVRRPRPQGPVNDPVAAARQQRAQDQQRPFGGLGPRSDTPTFSTPKM